MAGGYVDVYMRNYRKLLYLPFLLLLIALIVLGVKVARTGEVINRDISLKGGVAITVLGGSEVDLGAIEDAVEGVLPGIEVSARTIGGAGERIGFLVEADIESPSEQQVGAIVGAIGQATGRQVESYTIETIGSSLGESFFIETARAMLLAFMFMGIVVFLYFRSIVPSLAVILSAFSDIVVTIAITDMLGMRLGTAGIAALLMLIGYSIDTDIMLTTRVLKRQGMALKEALQWAFQTGMTMTLTTLAAVGVAFAFTQSEVIRQIMGILIIGLIVDIINTWIQNAGLLLWHVEK